MQVSAGQTAQDAQGRRQARYGVETIIANARADCRSYGEVVFSDASRCDAYFAGCGAGTKGRAASRPPCLARMGRMFFHPLSPTSTRTENLAATGAWAGALTRSRSSRFDGMWSPSPAVRWNSGSAEYGQVACRRQERNGVVVSSAAAGRQGCRFTLVRRHRTRNCTGSPLRDCDTLTAVQWKAVQWKPVCP